MMLIWIFLFYVQTLSPAFDFSSKLSSLVLKKNSSLKTSSATTNLATGNIVIDDGASISGNVFRFDSSNLSAFQDNSLQLTGQFDVDLAGSSISDINLGQVATKFWGPTTVSFLSSHSLSNQWTISADTIFQGNGNVFSASNTNARIVIKPGATLTLNNLNFYNYSLSKIIFEDATSVLKIVDSTVSFDTNITQTTGAYQVHGDTYFLLNDKDILLSSNATVSVSDGSSLWIDNRGSTNSPVFSTVSNTGFQSSLIDNLKVRVIVDQSLFIDPGFQNLVSNVLLPTPSTVPITVDPLAPQAVVEIAANSELKPTDQIVATTNVEISGGGTSMTFSNSGTSQLVIPADKAVTFGDIELLRITQSTFELQNGSNIRFKRNAVLEFVEDVTYDRGTFSILGEGGTVLLRGVGGLKRITLGTAQEGFSAGFLIGANKLILEDIELVGLHHFARENKNVDGVLHEGAIVLAGQSRVNVHLDTDMNFIIQGDNNKLVLQNNNLSLNGQVKFADLYDSTVKIAFSLAEDSTDLTLNLGKDSLILTAKEGQAGVIFDNDKVNIVNKSGSSFVAKSKSVIGGGQVIIKQNPIIQETNQLSLLPGLDLQGEVSTSPIQVQASSRDLFNYEFKGRTTKGITIPKANITVKNGLAGTNLQGTIAIRPAATVNNLKADSIQPLNLVMQGSSKVSTQIRRAGRVAVVAKDGIPTVVDELTDTFKSTDKIYVLGTTNTFKVTGNLEFKGQIILDEEAELIFEFDDSIDTPKSIKFTSDSGAFISSLPPTSSIVFQGNGLVFFEDASVVTFAGSNVEDLPVAADGSLKDDRPSMIFRNYAQLLIEDEVNVKFKGNGKLLFENGGQLNAIKGRLIIGQNANDFFEFNFDKQSSMTLGLDDAPEATATPGQVSLSQGLFNMAFDRGSELNIKNNSLFEIGLENGVYTNAFLSNVKFDRGAKLSVNGTGTISFGQSDISESANAAAIFNWDSRNSVVSGTGNIAFYTQGSTTPIATGRIQPRAFISTLQSPLEVYKSLVRVSTGLIKASDAIDVITGTYKLITANNVFVNLLSTDTIRFEGAETKNVYGTSAEGQRFVIFPDGTKQFLG